MLWDHGIRLQFVTHQTMNQTASEIDEDFSMLLPGDPGYDFAQALIIKRRAQQLSNHGWKFLPQKGPRGFYYEGFGPAGKRVMSEQCEELHDAFLKAVNHAHNVQFS